MHICIFKQVLSKYKHKGPKIKFRAFEEKTTYFSFSQGFFSSVKSSLLAEILSWTVMLSETEDRITR